ncbi:SDR family NAD(P)-dependent oxidoreductase [Pseudonocardia xishanensis]|uniref:SDR family NAD(P)-dependent oxidoreductase n=1 Tax=Pseudonocardia xishanensis TaxID=630995 RepID=A0ABP8RWW1_9PSEU
MSDTRLAGKVAIVTGGGARPGDGVGTGRAAAVLFARAGAKVLIVDRDAAAAKVTLDDILAEGGEAAVFEADLSDPADCAAMAADAVSRWGRIDVLDNNVGANARGSVVEASDDDWARAIELNVMTTVKVSRAVVPIMADGGGGAIVNLSSVSATRPRGLTPYSMAKGAVISLTRAMAVDHAPQGIRVNCVAPGPIYTPMVAGAGMDPELREKRKRATPLGVEGTGWDVGYAVLYLASDEARYVTGVMIPVDGGGSIKSPQS